jgi:iron-sulfur cluster repair protein YtfE (RIC family)
MDAFELLKADHEKVAGLFDQLEAASGKAKLEVFNEIKTELELHTQLEEKIFYPALEKRGETRELTMEAYEEHAVVKTLLRELSRARTANEEWEAKAKVLRENVEHHVEEEENELFPKAEGALSEQEFEKLSQRMEAEKVRKQQGAASKTSAKKSGTKKASGKKSASKAAKKTSGTKKAAATTKKASKSSGSKKQSGSKKSGSKKAGSKKSGSKKSGSKKSGSKKSAKKTRR